jgi:hypothetical protein
MACAESVIGLFGVTLLLVRAGSALGAGRRGVGFAALALALALVPLGGLPLVGYVRGITGDLSVTTLVLLTLGLLGRFVTDVEPHERHALSVLVVLGALFLYPMALGLGSFDPYRLGFEPSGLLAALFVVAVVAWFRQFYVLLVAVLVAVSSHALALMESPNLWDYLFDPWLVVASIYDLRSLRRKS